MNHNIQNLDKRGNELGKIKPEGEDQKDYQDFLNGDNLGFERLVLRYKDALIYFIHRYIKDITMAEDLAQDAFVEVFVHKERYRSNTSFKTYLYTIGRNKAVDYIRKNSRLLFVDEYPDAQAEELELTERVIREEEKKRLHLAIQDLKKEYQAAITLVDLEEMSYAEAARILNKTESQMKILIYRARKSLAKKLEGMGGRMRE